MKSILKSVNNNEIQILIKSAIELFKMIWFGALSCEPPWNLYLLKSTPKLKSAHISCTLNPVRAPILFQYCDSTARVHSLPLLWKYSLQICYSTVLASVPFNKHQSSSLQTVSCSEQISTWVQSQTISVLITKKVLLNNLSFDLISKALQIVQWSSTYYL